MNFLFRRKLRIVSFSPSLLLSATTKPGCQPGNGGDKKEREEKKKKNKKVKDKNNISLSAPLSCKSAVCKWAANANTV